MVSNSTHSARALAALVFSLCITTPAWARPTAPKVVCETYPDAPDCRGRVASCTLCHDTTDPPSWNTFGSLLKQDVAGGADFESALKTALHAHELDDADGDGLNNLDELLMGTSPAVANAGDEPDVPMSNPRYHLGGYDYAFAYKRVSTLYCGIAPSYQEMQTFRALADDAARTRLHEVLSDCLNGDYWRNDALPRLADKRIKPVAAAGADSKIMIGDYRLVVGDYWYDYRLWNYIMADDRDMRQLLTADFHIMPGPDGKPSESREILTKVNKMDLAGGEPLPAERRAGMITTQWFLSANTMFSAMPRTAAAQAYRAYLGADISNSEGLRPVQGEPVDVDKKGVRQPRCANCHSTLDPLAYAFASYEGIPSTLGTDFGSYQPDRPTRMIPGWNAAAQVSSLLDQPVHDLVEWGRVASESDEFKRAMAEMFFTHALGRKPRPEDNESFTALWKSCPEDGYSANRLVHRLIDSESFGAP